MSMTYRRPRALVPGDTVAVVSPSWGGPHAFPHIYEQGLAVLRGWGLRIREYPSTRLPDAVLHSDPALRARDINDACGDDDIAAVFASIGGDDSVRILPFLDAQRIARNPKIILGFSDTTTILSTIHQLGIVTFYGPSVMAGIAQSNSLSAAYRTHLHTMLFEAGDHHTYHAVPRYAQGYADWADTSAPNTISTLQYSRGWQFLQGSGTVYGQWYGGCVEVLEWLKGTPYWPSPGFWHGKILFLETSEEKPTAQTVGRWLRNYGVMGALGQISALVIGRPKDYTLSEQLALDATVLRVVRTEFGLEQLPIITDFDVGHTVPQSVIPLGVRTEIDCQAMTIRLVEPWLRP
ncbi:MAG: hypothetical protein RLZZ297_865 [Chloroflexota bacterium]